MIFRISQKGKGLWDGKYTRPYGSIDIYKQIRFLKDVLHMENMKQKSVERFLGIHRLDKYSGGDLIKVYQEYVKLPVKTNKQLLLQHNYEDLEGLLDCTSMLAYCKFKAGCLLVRKMSVRQNRLLFSLELEYQLPKRLTIGLNDIIITGFQKEATINAPIYTEELKFFFDNYRDYYYLPAEDMAVHKSVASYVDKNYREPAKKETCYLRKKDISSPRLMMEFYLATNGIMKTKNLLLN